MTVKYIRPKIECCCCCSVKYPKILASICFRLPRLPKIILKGVKIFNFLLAIGLVVYTLVDLADPPPSGGGDPISFNGICAESMPGFNNATEEPAICFSLEEPRNITCVAQVMLEQVPSTTSARNIASWSTWLYILDIVLLVGLFITVPIWILQKKRTQKACCCWFLCRTSFNNEMKRARAHCDGLRLSIDLVAWPILLTFLIFRLSLYAAVDAKSYDYRYSIQWYDSASDDWKPFEDLTDCQSETESGLIFATFYSAATQSYTNVTEYDPAVAEKWLDDWKDELKKAAWPEPLVFLFITLAIAIDLYIQFLEIQEEKEQEEPVELDELKTMDPPAQHTMEGNRDSTR